jgi:uncharacterized membrane protein HdeD (DUF308 family)
MWTRSSIVSSEGSGNVIHLRMTPRSRSPHKTGRKAVVWITFARGAMAIALGLALALHHDRAPAALANFMGVYWILNGVVTLQWA